ncbi:MAG: hypothetical protein R2681_10885 [Pyrinomonadaceae bacterium]
MKILKLIVLLLAVGLGAYVLMWLFGIIASLFWYVFWIGLILIGGTVGYKLFLGGGNDEQKRIEDRKPTAISELENADRALEDYKAKLQRENKGR